MIFQVDNIAKKYTEKVIFENVTLSIVTGEKVGLIGVNGTGKSTFLKVIAGVEQVDEGSISSPSDMRIAYLPQLPVFNDDNTIIDEVFLSDNHVLNHIKNYERLQAALEKDPLNTALQAQMEGVVLQMDALDAWSYESKVKTILTKLGIEAFHERVATLSGGQKKRLALAKALILPSDLMILDEPTNHLDVETIDWLEQMLKSYTGALIMITHDRYFLDRVVNRIIALDKGQLYQYAGNYQHYLSSKTEREDLKKTEEVKKQRLYKQELAWMRAGVQARGTKQKARKARFYDLEKNIKKEYAEDLIIDVAYTRMGKQTILFDNVDFSYTDKNILKAFNFLLDRDERLGIIGKNGLGKTTLLKLIVGEIKPDNGIITIGETIKVGYFKQDNKDLPMEKTALAYIKDIAEYVTTSKGDQITASQMLDKFLFDKNMQWTRIDKLSGGERRRLYLLSILMLAPNVLILDEPTNDLDIETMTILEAYLTSFKGALIAVSHDRYFLDKVCERIIAFEGHQIVELHFGNYTDYSQKQHKKEASKGTISDNKKKVRIKRQKIKMNYQEILEYKTIDADILACEVKLDAIDMKMDANATNFVELAKLSDEKDALEARFLHLLERKEYLDHLNAQIARGEMIDE